MRAFTAGVIRGHKSAAVVSKASHGTRHARAGLHRLTPSPPFFRTFSGLSGDDSPTPESKQGATLMPSPELGDLFAIPALFFSQMSPPMSMQTGQAW